MKRVAVCCAVSLGLAFPATAAELPGEADFLLAYQGAAVAAAQMQRSFQPFAQAVEALKQKAAVASYWEDACRSTPQCGSQ